MHSKLHSNAVHHDVELLLLVSMLFLLAIPKSPLILKEFYTLVVSIICFHFLQVNGSSVYDWYVCKWYMYVDIVKRSA